MKKMLLLALAVIMLVTFVFAIAEDSKGNEDIPHVDVPEDVEIEIVPDPETEKELIEELKTDYTLIIHYVYEDGTPVFDDYTAVLTAGTPYDVASPYKQNYTVSKERIADVMPKRNMEYTVYYRTDQDWTLNIDDYGTPLGLGFISMNEGVNFE